MHHLQNYLSRRQHQSCSSIGFIDSTGYRKLCQVYDQSECSETYRHPSNSSSRQARVHSVAQSAATHLADALKGIRCLVVNGSNAKAWSYKGM